MSRPQGPQRPFFPFGNPFRMILPKGSYLSPKLLALLNSFEETLAEKLKALKPGDKGEILSLTWMISALESLCAIHSDVKYLITALELPISDWDEKWIDVYLENSVKLLDVCIAFSSEISRVNQGHLFLQCVIHNLDSASSMQVTKAKSSLDGWRQHVISRNPRLDKCFTILDNLVHTLDLPKIKNSSKGKVLMQAMYGVRVVTVYVCSVFAAAFSGSVKKLLEFPAPETCLWAKAFTDVQAMVNGEIRNLTVSSKFPVVNELEAVDICVKKLHPLVQTGEDTVEAEALTSPMADLRKSADTLSQGLDLLAKEVDSFFQIVLTGRDALLGNLRIGSDVSSPMQQGNHVEGQIIR